MYVRLPHICCPILVQNVEINKTGDGEININSVINVNYLDFNDALSILIAENFIFRNVFISMISMFEFDSNALGNTHTVCDIKIKKILYIAT